MNNKTQQHLDTLYSKLIINCADEIDNARNQTFPQRVAIEEDGDEIFHFDGKCNKWECQEGFDKEGKAIMPYLLATWHDDDRMAFWECPTCHCSYGPVENPGNKIGKQAYPVGFYLQTFDSNPADSLGFGEWEPVADRYATWKRTK